MTNDLQRRVWEHRENVLPGFTRRYGCKELVFYEMYPDPRSAIAREKQLKNWNRDKKNALIAALNPRWDDLSRRLFPSARWMEGRRLPTAFALIPRLRWG